MHLLLQRCRAPVSASIAPLTWPSLKSECRNQGADDTQGQLQNVETKPARMQQPMLIIQPWLHCQVLAHRACMITKSEHAEALAILGRLMQELICFPIAAGVEGADLRGHPHIHGQFFRDDYRPGSWHRAACLL